MRIESVLKSKTRGGLKVVYEDADSVPAALNVTVVHAYCFYQGKLIIAFHKTDNRWTLPGGSVELGESWDQATIREIQEEANMRVIKQQLVGYQQIYLPDGTMSVQTRAAYIVEPYGEFVSDPDGDISEIKLIDPSELKEYVDWGEIGDHILEQAISKIKS